jgi:acetyl esterase/lipase
MRKLNEAREDEMGGMPSDVAKKIREIGPKFNPEILAATQDLYRHRVNLTPAPGVTVTKDVAYGADPRQKLDVYRAAGSNNAILVYIPGGGFVGGDKDADGVFYVNLGLDFARYGITTVIANYRLAPQFKFPSGSEDVGAAVAWARENAATIGGDPRRIFAFGQSAGAAHVASYLFDPSVHGAKGPGLAGGLLTSGPYHSDTKNPLPPMKAYYGDDVSLWEERAPYNHVKSSKLPLFLGVAEFDPAFLAAPTFELAQAVTLRDGKSPDFVWSKGHNHVSTVMAFGSEDDELGSQIRAFIAAH